MTRGRDLLVYKRAFAAAVKIKKLSDTWPKHELYNGLANQLQRASQSICANIAEGMAKHGPLEQRRFLNISLGSAEEVIVWLEFAEAFGYLSEDDNLELEKEYNEIGKILFKLMQLREKKKV